MAEVDRQERETAERDTYFKDTLTGKTYQRVRDSAVVDAIAGISGGLLNGIIFDAITGSYPDSITEVYEYRSGGVSGTVNATVTVIYVDSTKAAIVSVVKT